jgi:hypothetical protein
MSRMSEHVGASNSRNPKCLHGLCRGNFTFRIKRREAVQLIFLDYYSEWLPVTDH